jgi:hypothetical protein
MTVRAAILDQDGFVLNIVMLGSLNDVQGAINGDNASVGDQWDGANFIKANIETVEHKRERIWEAIKVHRKYIIDGGFSTNGHWYHSDIDSKTEFNTLKLKALEHMISGGNMNDKIVIDGTNTKIKTMDNGYMEVSHNDILAIVAAGEIHTKRAYECAATHQYCLNLSSTPETYDWSTGWQPIYTGS